MLYRSEGERTSISSLKSMMLTRDDLTRLGATMGIDTSLFEAPEEWELLEGIIELHCANRRDEKESAQRARNQRS